MLFINFTHTLFKVPSLALGQPSASEITLKDMDKEITSIHKSSHNEAYCNGTMSIFFTV